MRQIGRFITLVAAGDIWFSLVCIFSLCHVCVRVLEIAHKFSSRGLGLLSV